MSKTYATLSKVTTQWGAIQEENLSHRRLVTKDEWATWESFNKQTVETLKAIIKEYDANSGTLYPDTLAQLEQLQRTIESAKHMSAEELQERNTPASGLLKNFHN